ncbi:hypothetical protein ACE38V_02445 [Cytobacillus sp. Hz8]|uniref:hypothetical protein n=1 Tax=Cytobacillus sp. Hz8 TaxID=3347168 RepID=UPI0035E15729
MNRYDRHSQKKKLLFYKTLFIFTSVLIIGFFSIHLYLKSLIKIDTPNKDLGRKIIIEMPNGKDIYTYENLIINEDGKLLYKGERNTLDLTGGKIIYKKWK